MANLYGVANGTPQAGIFGNVGSPSNVTCPAGVETTCFTMAAYGLSPGYYYPIIFAEVLIQYGATLPGALQVAGKIGAGSDFDVAPINVGVVAASTTYFYSYVLVGPESSTIYVPPGSTINVTIAPTGQAVTMLSGGSRCVLWLCRGNDV